MTKHRWVRTPSSYWRCDGCGCEIGYTGDPNEFPGECPPELMVREQLRAAVRAGFLAAGVDGGTIAVEYDSKEGARGRYKIRSSVTIVVDAEIAGEVALSSTPDQLSQHGRRLGERVVGALRTGCLQWVEESRAKAARAKAGRGAP